MVYAPAKNCTMVSTSYVEKIKPSPAKSSATCASSGATSTTNNTHDVIRLTSSLGGRSMVKRDDTRQ